MRNLAIFLFFCQIFVTDAEFLPGCYSLLELENLANNAGNNLDLLRNLPICYCDNATETENATNSVAISCVFNPTIDDLSKTLKLVEKAERAATSVYLMDMNFDNGRIATDFFRKNHHAQLTHLEFENCHNLKGNMFDFQGPEENALTSLENSLTFLGIKNCPMFGVPYAINSLKSLKTLQIQNSLQKIGKHAFSRLKNLKTLDLSQNSLTFLPENVFFGLENLTSLDLGPGNFFINSSVFEEINSNLVNLHYVNLQKVHISEIPANSLNNLTNLRELAMAGNDIENLNSDAFSGLVNLHSLDLQVNFIEKIEDDVFEPLKSLRTLKLAGNYIHELRRDWFESLTNLTNITLGWNEFKTVANYTFANLTNLQNLDLGNNYRLGFLESNSFEGLSNLLSLNLKKSNITKLENGVFDSLNSLENLNFAESRIIHLDKNVFRNTRNLISLSLSKNNLETLPAQIFNHLGRLKSLNLEGNPWVCDSRLAPTINWIFKKYRTAAEAGISFSFEHGINVTCAQPLELQGRPILALDTNTLKPYDPISPTVIVLSDKNDTTVSQLNANATVDLIEYAETAE